MKERLNEKKRLNELERLPIQSNQSPSTINSSLTINYVTDASELEKTNETPNFISNSTTIDRFEEVDNNV
ncbi:hypothetical protein J9332_45825, partial [Aquimarina celericrescens]|nr:hypothetical protein [Aquimarina celericrescens]